MMDPTLAAHLDDLRKKLARAEGERDDLKAEVANLRQAVDHYERLNQELHADNLRLAAMIHPARKAKDAPPTP